MIQAIHIGVLDGNPGWEQILSQIGVSWSRATLASVKKPNQFSCIIVTRTFSREERSLLESYIESGRSVIDSTGQFLPALAVQKKLSYITPDDKSIFSHISTFSVNGKCLVYPASDQLDGTLWFDPSQKRSVAFIGIPVHLLQELTPMASTLFKSSELPAVQERTAHICSDHFLDVILTVLKVLHAKSQIPFIHKWWMPDQNKLTATFRIDSDYGSKQAVNQIAGTALEHNVPLTWFLHVSAHENWLSHFKSFEEHEIAVHCFNHNEYKSSQQYFSDISHAFKRLREAGYKPQGYASPYGVWNQQLTTALKQFAFRYSSEFGYDYDSLPSTPQQSRILQLPIHPISAGSLRRFGFTGEMTRQYFDEIINLKILQHKPIHLYHHPNDKQPELLSHIFQRLNHDKALWLTYSEWAEWWQKRNSVSFKPMYSNEGKTIYCNTSDKVPIAVHKDEAHFFLTHETEFHLDESRFYPYIEPQLQQLIKKKRYGQGMSSFKQIKDKLMARLWRNRV